jgi:hypothetical protein
MHNNNGAYFLIILAFAMCMVGFSLATLSSETFVRIANIGLVVLVAAIVVWILQHFKL